MEQAKHLDALQQKMDLLIKDVAKMRLESRVEAKASTEKLGIIKPNKAASYPKSNCSDELYTKAVTAMSAEIKRIEKNCTFAANSYNWALEVMSSSNQVASNFGLSEMQHRELILSMVPRSDLSIELDQMELTEMYKYVSSMSETLLTRGETEGKIDSWSIKLGSYGEMTMSIQSLKSLYMRLDNPKNAYDLREIYDKVVARVRREKSLNSTTLRLLEQARIRNHHEESQDCIIENIISAIKPSLKASGKAAESLAVEVDSKSGGGAKRKQRQKKPQEMPFYMKSGNCAEPFPMNKPTKIAGTNNYSPEVNEHFKGRCYKCGFRSHSAKDCMTYKDSEVPIAVDICKSCRRGFHVKCLFSQWIERQKSRQEKRGNWKGKGKQGKYNEKSEGNRDKEYKQKKEAESSELAEVKATVSNMQKLLEKREQFIHPFTGFYGMSSPFGSQIPPLLPPFSPTLQITDNTDK